jgi:hypothetical protein
MMIVPVVVPIRVMMMMMMMPVGGLEGWTETESAMGQGGE